LAAVPTTVWTNPCTSVPTWAFIPKSPGVALLGLVLSGIALFAAFLVEGAAAMIVASMSLFA